MQSIERGQLALLYLLTATLLILPLLATPVPHLNDYSGHLARAYIVNAIATDPNLDAVYDIEWKILPNLASDAVLYVLTRFVSVEIAGKAFLGLCLLLTLGGVAALHGVLFRRLSAWPLLAALPAYHGAFMTGFINFAFAASLIPFGLALWIAVRGRPWPLRLVANSLMAMVLFLSHGFGFGLFCLLVVGYEAWLFCREPAKRLWSKPADLAVSMIPLLAPFAFYLPLVLSRVATGPEPAFDNWQLLAKARGLLMPILAGNLWFDPVGVVLVAAIGLIVAFRSRPRIARCLLPGLALLGLAFLVLPQNVLGTAFMSDRVPIVAALVGLAAIEPVGLSRRYWSVILACALALMLIRSMVLVQEWSAAGAWYEKIRAMTGLMERRSMVLVAHPATGFLRGQRFAGYPEWQFDPLGVPSLENYVLLPLAQRSVFTPGQFTSPDQQILSVEPPYRAYDRPHTGYVGELGSVFACAADGTLRLQEEWAAFDYVLVLYVDRLPAETQAGLRALGPLDDRGDILLLGVARLPVADPADRPLRSQATCGPGPRQES